MREKPTQEEPVHKKWLILSESPEEEEEEEGEEEEEDEERSSTSSGSDDSIDVPPYKKDPREQEESVDWLGEH